MHIYTLDNQLRRTSILDVYESFIWTERWKAMGDFELKLRSNPVNRARFREGTQFVIDQSDYVMTVETVEVSNNDDGKKVLTLTGRSLEGTILDERVGMLTLDPQGVDKELEWYLGGTPAAVARRIFKDICVDGKLNFGDRFPFYTLGDMYPATNIPEPGTWVDFTFPIGSVYEALKTVCDTWRLGFRLTRRGDTSRLYFNVYSGNNRTTSQTVLPPVVFSPSFDNLTNINEIASTALQKNVCYVFSHLRVARVYADGMTQDTIRFDRKVMYVDATDIKETDTAKLDALLIQRGRDALAKAQFVQAFDGEISESSQYKYRRDYELGDLVEMRTEGGLTNIMRVTEQIFASDAEGDRSYPTLEVERFITPGSWEDWKYNITWDAATGTWNEQ